ncbi:MAG: nucleoside-triphosphatase [Candidatus Odinarchaeota archaeon]
MKPTILLTGLPGIGKTTTILEIIKKLPGPVSGFYTREIRKQNRRTGFEIVCLDGERGILASTEEQFEVKFGRYTINLRAIEELMVTRMQSPKGTFILDEIGRMELLCPEFRAVLFSLIDRGDIIATISLRDTQVTASIKSHPLTVLFELTLENRDVMADIIIDFLVKKETS